MGILVYVCMYVYIEKLVKIRNSTVLIASGGRGNTQKITFFQGEQKFSKSLKILRKNSFIYIFSSSSYLKEVLKIKHLSSLLKVQVKYASKLFHRHLKGDVQKKWYF